jgi:hypothetical protein
MLDAMTGTPSGALAWRVSPALPALKLAGAAALGLLALVFGADAVRWALAAVAIAGLLAWAARDLLAPVRLAADAAGVRIISGYAGTRDLPWERIERVQVDARPRLGLRTETLEIDAGDTLHLFGPYDLNAPPAEVAARLNALRSDAPRSDAPRSGGQDAGGGQH